MKNAILSKYYYNLFTMKKSGSSVDRIGLTLFNSKIRLTPHQIDASLFAFKSPISKGVLLADEVGLGKTIEAGIIIAQLWYERKGKVLIISPASLMRQWNIELYEKFLLNSVIIDRKLFNTCLRKGYKNPFDSCGNIVICSYQFASLNAEYIRSSNFSIVIIDEAHKLRNAYTGKSIICNNIKYATENIKKILLTATPIQNSLMDLYGITSFIDDNIFGDKNIFKINYIKNLDNNIEDLKSRLSNFMHRTLRNNVTQYIKYTNRIAKTFAFVQTNEENEIYETLRNLIINSESIPYIIPKKQSHLLLLILSKLMGSSIYALSGTLEVILHRLNNLKNNSNITSLEISDLINYDNEFGEELGDLLQKDDTIIEQIDYEELNREIKLIENLLLKTKKINKESKYYSLIDSLNYSFDFLKDIGANEKVLIFTESRRTQSFLYSNLKNDGFKDIVLYNGTNNDDESKQIYEEWINRPENSDKKDNNKNLNMRSAIIDKFRNDGKILIATEAGAEGLNLQFCSLIINYDLPWNPQRVEQRIGRCHRFGQQFDVTVINFINSSNRAEQRIYELLSSKFNLFDEVFGASDEILGSLDDNTNIELSISQIYKNCRTTEEIDQAFDELQMQYNMEIEKSLKETKKKLIDNFEEDIQHYFSDMIYNAEKELNDMEYIFWNLSKCILGDKATFDDEEYIVNVVDLDGYDGIYKLSSRNIDNKYLDFNSSSKLGLYIMDKAKEISINRANIVFDVTNYPNKISQVENLTNKKGLITLNKLIILSYDKEEYLYFNGILEDGTRLDDEICKKIFRTYKDENLDYRDYHLIKELMTDAKVYSQKIINESSEKNNNYLIDEISKINKSADDKIQAIELLVSDMREQRKILQRQSDLAANVLEKQHLEAEISKITKKIKESWINLADLEEKVESDRLSIIEKLKENNSGEVNLETIFTISFEIK